MSSDRDPVQIAFGLMLIVLLVALAVTSHHVVSWAMVGQ
jgi:hypothetical protein